MVAFFRFQLALNSEIKKKKSYDCLHPIMTPRCRSDIRLHFYTTCCQNIPQLLFVWFFFFFVLSEMRGWIYISVRCDTHASLCSALCSCYSSELLFFVPSLSGKDDFFVYLVILVFQCPIAIKPRFVYKSHMGPQTQWFVYWIEGRRHVTLQSLTLWQRRQNATWAPNWISPISAPLSNDTTVIS